MAHGPPAKKRTENENGEDDDSVPVPPDGGWGWVVVFGSFMVHVITDGITYSFGIFYVEFLNYFQEGKGFTALIVSLLVGVTLCSGPISSTFVNKYGCRVVTIVGALIAGVCLIISVFAQNVLTLIITIGIGAGLGLGLIYLPAIVSVTTYFEKYRSLATGIAVCGSGFGTFVFAPLTEFLVTTFGWRGAMLIIAAIVLHCMLFGALFRPLKAAKKKPDAIALPTETEMYQLNHIKNGENLPQEQIISNNNISLTTLPRSVSYGHSMAQKNQKNNSTAQFNGGRIEEKDESGGGGGGGGGGNAGGGGIPIGLRSTLSSPLLNSDLPQNLQSQSKLHGSGTLSRPDIFYQGSLLNIPHYRSRMDLHESVRHTPLRSQSIVEEIEEPRKICGCIKTTTRDTFVEMMNFDLFHDSIFILFTVSNFCTSLGFNIPYVYLAPQAEVLQLTKEQASYLLATIGIANTVGRIVLGYLADQKWVNRLYIYNTCLTICGVATILSIFATGFISMAIYAAVFGFTIGAYVGLTSVILVDLLGLDKLTNAFGLLLLFQGISSLIGPPIAGTLYDMTNSYAPGFILAGITISISGLILFSIPALRRHNERKNNTIVRRLEEGLTM